MRTLVLMTTSLFLFTGCGAIFDALGGGKKSKTKKKASNPAYVGPLTIENKSSHAICSVEISTRDKKTRKKTNHRLQNKIAPKGTATLTIAAPTYHVMLFSCGGVLATYGKPVEVSKVVLVDDKASAGEGDQLTLVAKPAAFTKTMATIDRYNKSSFANAKSDATLTKKVLQAAKEKAVSSRWKDTPRFARLASKDWFIYRNKRTGIITHRAIQAYIGHDFGGDKCTVQVHLFSQQHNGTDFAGPVNYYATGHMAGRASMSCAMYDWLGAQQGTTVAQK